MIQDQQADIFDRNGLGNSLDLFIFPFRNKRNGQDGLNDELFIDSLQISRIAKVKGPFYHRNWFKW